ncbi:Mitochondrial import inner membrane translocase subunit Tim17-A [Coelomomyces lativittatus]|nr:Mitochondrial import inner membrane translocase subunit Tim17-A [Coelomomyces lativittatus]
MQGERFHGAFTAMKLRGPVVGGGFGIWGGLFSTFDCAFAGLRQKEDAWNSIISGAASGAVLSARSGWKMACSSAVFGGLVLAMIEGVGVLLNRQSAEMTRPQAPILPPELVQQAQLQHA